MDYNLLKITWLSVSFALVVWLILHVKQNKDGKKFFILSSNNVAWGVISGLLFFFFFQPFLLFPNFLAGSSTVLGDIINLGLGVIGLVITASTGIAVATSWRALDDARRADDHATSALSEYLQVRKNLEGIILTHSAFLEASNVRSELDSEKDSLEYRVADGFCDALIASNEASRREAIYALSKDDQYSSVARKIFNLSLQENAIHVYLKSIIRDPSLPDNQRNMLSDLISREKRSRH